MSTNDDKTLELEQLVLEDLKLRESEEAIKERRATIKAELAKHLSDGTHDLAGSKVIVSHPRRIDAKAAAAALPFTDRPELYKATLDTALLKRHLSPVDLEAFQVEGNVTVTVR